MAGRKKNPAQTEATRRTFLEKSFELFGEKSIESVTMSQIAKASGFRDMTLYRYFPSKPILVVAVATWKWQKFLEEDLQNLAPQKAGNATAAEMFENYLDCYLELYRSHRNLLRFTQFFNVYVQSEHVDAKTLEPYQVMIKGYRERFHNMYEKAKKDGTIRTDESEEEMFSKTLHLMLAAVTRYAVGLVYIPETGPDPEKELEFLKEIILKEYRTK